MSRVTVTFQDDGGEVRVSAHYEPYLTTGQYPTAAQEMALDALEYLRLLHLPTKEHGRPSARCTAEWS